MHLPRLSNKDLSCYYVAAAETECTVIRISFQGYYFPSQHQCFVQKSSKKAKNKRKNKKNQYQRDQKKANAINLWLDDADDPV